MKHDGNTRAMGNHKRSATIKSLYYKTFYNSYKGGFISANLFDDWAANLDSDSADLNPDIFFDYEEDDYYEDWED